VGDITVLLMRRELSINLGLNWGSANKCSQKVCAQTMEIVEYASIFQKDPSSKNSHFGKGNWKKGLFEMEIITC